MSDHLALSVAAVAHPCASLTTEQKINMYIESMTERERRAYAIANDHLKQSFTTQKTIGYRQFCAKIEKED